MNIFTAFRAIVLAGLCMILAGIASPEGDPVSRANHPSRETTYYAEALKTVGGVHHVFIRGMQYDIRDGVVYRNGAIVADADASHALRIAYAQMTAARAPLLALAGTNPNQFERAIDELRSVQYTLAELQSDSKKAAAVRHDLYPLTFLRSMAALERARQAFLSSGSDRDLAAYQRASFIAARDYQHDLERFSRGFSVAVPHDAPPYVTVRNRLDAESMHVAIRSLEASMTRTQSLLVSRARCIRGEFGNCRAEDRALPRIDVPSQENVTAAAIAYAQQKTTQPPVRDLLEGTDRANEPLIALADPICTQEMPGPTLFMLRLANDVPGQPRKVPMYIGNGRLVDITTQPNVGFFGYFRSHGSTYVPSTPMVYYECLNYTRDASSLMSVNAAREVARTAPLSSTATDPALAKHLRTLESTLRTPSAITERDALAYVSAGMQAVRDGNLTEAGESIASELGLAVRNGSASYENQLLDMSEIERVNAILYKKGLAIGLDATSLFYTRSGLAALFMAYNPSVSGARQDLFDTVLVPQQMQPYLYYDELSPAQQAQADRDKEFYYQVHAHPTAVQ